MRSLELTATGIVRALSTVDDALREKAKALAARLSVQGIDARVESRGDGSYAVIAAGGDLFAREFGSPDRQPEGPLEEAVRDLKTGIAE